MDLYLPIMLDMGTAKAKDPHRTDNILKIMIDSWMPADEGMADRCYYIPGE